METPNTNVMPGALGLSEPIASASVVASTSNGSGNSNNSISPGDITGRAVTFQVDIVPSISPGRSINIATPTASSNVRLSQSGNYAGAAGSGSASPYAPPSTSMPSSPSPTGASQPSPYYYNHNQAGAVSQVSSVVQSRPQLSNITTLLPTAMVPNKPQHGSGEIKRPRGRPPLSGKRKLDANGQPIASPRQQSSDSVELSKNGTDGIKVCSSGGFSNEAPTTPSSTGALVATPTSTASGTPTNKGMKHQLAVQCILQILMVNQPQSLQNLTVSIPEATKETIQSCLDVLQVMGIVDALRQQPTTVTSTLTASSVAVSASSNYYTMSNYSIGDIAVPLHQVPRATHAKLVNTERTLKRIKLLQVCRT
jgi:hypothetical protein